MGSDIVDFTDFIESNIFSYGILIDIFYFLEKAFVVFNSFTFEGRLILIFSCYPKL